MFRDTVHPYSKSLFYRRSYEWKECEVTAYDRYENTFTIVWEHSGKEKAVRRLNLMLDTGLSRRFVVKTVFPSG